MQNDCVLIIRQNKRKPLNFKDFTRPQIAAERTPIILN